MDDLLTSAQLNFRGFLQEIDHPIAGTATYPGPPWWIGPDAWRHGRAPLLGEHTEPILREIVGLSAAELARLSPEVPA